MIFRVIPSSTPQAATTTAAVTVRHEITRLLVARNQAADQEPALRGLFNELTDGFIAAPHELLSKLSVARVDFVHALFVGLSVIDLATSRANGEARALAVLETALGLLSPTEDAAVANGKNELKIKAKPPLTQSKAGPGRARRP